MKERLQQRKKAREEIVLSIANDIPVTPVVSKAAASDSRSSSPVPTAVQGTKTKDKSSILATSSSVTSLSKAKENDREVEKKLLLTLCDIALNLPTDSRALALTVTKALNKDVPYDAIENLLQKFATQELISIKEGYTPEGKPCLTLTAAEHTKLTAFSNELSGILTEGVGDSGNRRKRDSSSEDEPKAKVPTLQKDNSKNKDKKDESIESLLSMPSIREKENKKMGEEILDLLSKPTAKERSLAERFRSQGGVQVQEFCPHGTREECMKVSGTNESCRKLHFKKIIQKHTDESLGDCSFLNTCFHMDTCKYVHYEVDYAGTQSSEKAKPDKDSSLLPRDPASTLYPAQWIQCDLRYFDMAILGKYAVIMADPPWDIHMELPYGTMSDDEMRQLNIPALQDDGFLFLWVTGRAMELGRECLSLWGYERCDEIIWVKTNQLQRIIRTGRTGHWMNHGKEHCLVGTKGNPKGINRGLDCDVIVAEVRATSHKPDEIYGMIERLSPGTRKIELFGRPHNSQPNWMTLGNQLDGVRLLDNDLIRDFQKAYPDGNCMVPVPKS